MVGKYAEFLHEQMAVVATIDPQSSSAELNADVIDMLRYRRLLVIIQVGAMGASATLDADVEIDTVVGMNAHLTTLKSITQLTKAGSDDNKQVLIEVTAEEVANGITGYHGQGRFVRLELTNAVAANLVAVVILGALARYEPADQADLGSVDEIVV